MRPERIRLLFLLTSVVLLVLAVVNITRCAQDDSPRVAAGATGLRVTGLQWLLNAAGSPVSVTGTYATQTTAAVRDFQARSGLKESGSVDDRTFTRLSPDTVPGDRGLRVRAVQTLLNLHDQPIGIYDDFDPATADAVKRFQDTAGLKQTGEVNRDTWDALLDGPNSGRPVSEADQFLATMAPHAKENRHRYGVPEAVALAQASQETGWGRSAPGNNYFGVKCHGRPAGPVAYTCEDRATIEWENGRQIETKASFRSYASMRDSILDYGNFLRSNPRYAAAFARANDADSFARELQRAGYATDPTYADSLIQIMQARNLYAYAN